MKFEDCNLCDERRYARVPVPGEGNKQLAKICFLGRNPGEREDYYGRPFIGKAGGKLDEGLIIAGILRNECYITNLSKCMTPKDVVPSVICRRKCAEAWLSDELDSLEKLELVVTLGNQALQYFEPLARVGALHGTTFESDRPWVTRGTTVRCEKIRLFVSYHPSAALRSSAINKNFIADMQKLGKLVKEHCGT